MERNKTPAPSLNFLDVAKQAGLRINELGTESPESALLDAPTFLIYGVAGTGKTYSIRTLPKPSIVIEFDKGTQMLEIEARRGEIEGITIISIPLDYPGSDIPSLTKGGTLVKNKETPQAWKHLTTAIDLILASDNFHGYKCVVIDSITAAADMALIDVLARTKKTLAIPEIQHWGEQMYMLKNQLVAKLRHIAAWAPDKVSIPCVCFGHAAMIDYFGGGMGWAPQITGKLATEVARFFREEYITKRVLVAGKKNTYKYLWVPVSESAEAKSTFGFTEPMEQNFEALFARVDKMREAKGVKRNA